ncbi:MAG: malate synthase A [Polyangiaceae bacterium]
MIHLYGITLEDDKPAGAEDVLTPAALEFVEMLTLRFGKPLQELLEARKERAKANVPFDFLPETKSVREGDWRVAETPAEILDRRVEITGPVDRKMVINALNSGANVFMADFEDATCPTWHNLIAGQRNLKDANLGTIRLEQGGKVYALNEKHAVLFVRPRGLHLREAHVTLDGEPVPGPLFDFGLYFFHNVKTLLEKGTRPFFYLPKLESYLEARWWNEVLTHAEKAMRVPVGTARATVLIETLPAAFQMDEILYELREHSVGLNCGRWDYIFSFIKKQANDPKAVVPDRSQVTMDKGFLRAYAELLVRTCHRRGAHAMGGMAAQIPIKGDEAANAAALAKVRADKEREVRAGHDGTWVAHPALVAVAKEVFDREMPGPNQLNRPIGDGVTTAKDLLAIPEGTRTMGGVRHNIRVGIQYIEAWLRCSGCVPIYNLMEDAATAEICRSQVWQQLKHGTPFEDGPPLTVARVNELTAEELKNIEGELGSEAFARGRFAEAAKLFLELVTAEKFEEFLTLPAYDKLLHEGN